MTILFLICLLSCFIGVKFQKTKYWPDYMKQDRTLAFCGIFVMLVFFRHFVQYIEPSAGDRLFLTINGMLRQLVITPFLFYSGYGIMISIMQKENYVKKLPKRIARVWLQFALVVLVYYLINCLFGRAYPVKNLMLSLSGIYSIGNSNWYIFAILILYLFTFIAFALRKNNLNQAILLVSGLCIGYILILKLLNFPTYFYDTILVYPMGLVFGLYQNKIETWITGKQKRYYGLFLGSIVLFAILYLFRNYVVVYEMLSMIFIAICVLFTMKIQLNNKWLHFLGQHIFEIYILQRIPMMILYSFHLPTVVYFALSFGITLGLAIVLRKAFYKVLK